MYKRNVKPLDEFLGSYPPSQDDTTSTADSGSSTTSRARWQEQSTRGRTLQEPPSSLRCIRLFQVWKSSQNGWVYDSNGIAPCLSVGRHSGVEPKIIEYEHRRQLYITASPQKRFGFIRLSNTCSPTLLGTDYKSPHLVIEYDP